VYRLPAIAAILFCYIRMKVVQQLTCLTLGRPNGPAYSTGELLNTPQFTHLAISQQQQQHLCSVNSISQIKNHKHQYNKMVQLNTAVQIGCFQHVYLT